MPNNRLILFVEGPTDEDFVRRVLCPRNAARFDDVFFNRYAGLPPAKRNAFVHSARAAGWDYVWFVDLDDFPCVTERKNAVVADHPAVASGRIAVVVREIEGWYLAGLDGAAAHEIGLSTSPDPNVVTKEEFAGSVPRRFRSRRGFMQEILRSYSLDEGVERNASLKYCVAKFFS